MQVLIPPCHPRRASIQPLTRQQLAEAIPVQFRYECRFAFLRSIVNIIFIVLKTANFALKRA